MNRHFHRARILLAGLVAVTVVAVAPATAGERTKPPSLKVANRGESFKAAMGTYEWCYKSGDGFTCAVADAFAQPKSQQALPVQPGDKVVLRPHAKVKSIEVSTYGGETYPNQPQRVEGKPRVWTLKIAKGVGKRKDLVAFVRYARQGNDATFGFGIRKAEQSHGLP